MNIQFSSASTTQKNESTYKSFDLVCENKSATVLVVCGKFNYVSVVVNNASHRAFRGMGKEFATFEQAIENYSDIKIKAMIDPVKFEA